MVPVPLLLIRHFHRTAQQTGVEVTPRCGTRLCRALFASYGNSNNTHQEECLNPQDEQERCTAVFESSKKSKKQKKQGRGQRFRMNTQMQE